jgi:hypothetical protein
MGEAVRDAEERHLEVLEVGKSLHRIICFGNFMMKAVINGRGNEVVDPLKTTFLINSPCLARLSPRSFLHS